IWKARPDMWRDDPARLGLVESLPRALFALDARPIAPSVACLSQASDRLDKALRLRVLRSGPRAHESGTVETSGPRARRRCRRTRPRAAITGCITRLNERRTTMHPDDRELATILAALRYWQRHGLKPDGSTNAIPEDDVATDGGTLEPLDAA